MKYILIAALAVMFSGCTVATWELLYSDARVVYQDAKYVVHEYKDSMGKDVPLP